MKAHPSHPTAAILGLRRGEDAAVTEALDGTKGFEVAIEPAPEKQVSVSDGSLGE